MEVTITLTQSEAAKILGARVGDLMAERYGIGNYEALTSDNLITVILDVKDSEALVKAYGRTPEHLADVTLKIARMTGLIR